MWILKSTKSGIDWTKEEKITRREVKSKHTHLSIWTSQNNKETSVGLLSLTSRRQVRVECLKDTHLTLIAGKRSPASAFMGITGDTWGLVAGQVPRCLTPLTFPVSLWLFIPHWTITFLSVVFCIVFTSCLECGVATSCVRLACVECVTLGVFTVFSWCYLSV